ncbi:hypothetical protein [Bradymonas sediminis]|uniref:Uncharacterized protein n=1 Tax=Bradymonas sediminis TaxID=1548548 RepID=A0A2Z4FLD2_9DELT|nr:hypothetical protein [Bradymonas sediminis]AWV89817.1 hypothetical protein DN745_10890 [Bradymonas sediminis]TDP76436.1 hypothetical protein DFR33_10265 [Bradymonas sediminis]
MSESNQTLVSRAEFLELAAQAGFEIGEEQLDELLRRNLLRAWEPKGSRTPQAHFHRLHLYMLARYFDAARTTRHPWGALAPSVGLAEIAGLARECRDLVGLLVEVDAGEDAVEADSQALMAKWAKALAERAAELNPFGPLAGVAALLSPQAQAQLRGHGLQFLVFSQLAAALGALVEDAPQPAESAAVVAEPEPAPAVEVEAEVEAPKPAEPTLGALNIDHDAVAFVRETAEQDAVSRADIELAPVSELSEVSWGEDEVTTFDVGRSQDALKAEMAVEEPVTRAEKIGDKIPHGFGPEDSEPTSRTEDLQTRLARLRREDESAVDRAQSPAAEVEIAEAATDADEAVEALVLEDEVGADGVGDDTPEAQAQKDPDAPRLTREMFVEPLKDEPSQGDEEEDESLSGLEDIFDEALRDPDVFEASEVFEDEVAGGAELVEESEEILELDAVVQKSAEDAPVEVAEDTKEDDLHDLKARTDRLNQLREIYLAEQRWEELVALYEDGLDLFVDPVDRQRVFLTLALLFEVKLKRSPAAFEQFERAYVVGGDPAGRAKAFEGMQRLGRQSAVQSRWAEFLEAELSSEALPAAARAELQRHLALVLHSLGSQQRAFYTYTAFLADARPDQLDEHAFDELERLAEDVGKEELGDIYADLLAHALPDETFESMALRAARHHADMGEVGLAMEYYERVLARFPRHEVAFHSLSQLYEDAERWVPLRALYETRIALSAPETSGALRSELERIEALMASGAISD